MEDSEPFVLHKTLDELDELLEESAKRKHNELLGEPGQLEGHRRRRAKCRLCHCHLSLPEDRETYYCSESCKVRDRQIVIFWLCFVSLLVVLFIALKLTGVISWSWWVLSPLCLCGIFVIKFIYLYELKSQRSAQVIETLAAVWELKLKEIKAKHQ